VSDYFASWMAGGYREGDLKAVRDTFKPVFEDAGFSISLPKMDEVVERQLAKVKSNKYILQRENAWKSVQLKLIDLVKPLMVLYTLLDPNSEACIVLESAFKIWADANFFITNSRRTNVVNSIYPVYKDLLKDPAKFSPLEIAHLFGNSFTESMLKAADDDARLQKVAKQPRKSFNRPRSGDTSSASRPADSSGSSGVQTRSRGTRYDPLTLSLEVSASTPLPEASRPKVGARLSLFSSTWHSVTSDPWVLDVVYNGLSLDFLSFPSQAVVPPDIPMTSAMTDICDKAVADMLEKGAIVPSGGGPGFFSRLFAVPKSAPGTWRPIIDLRPVNECIRYEHFKMEGLVTARQLIEPGDWMAKVDLRDAYFTVPISSSHRRFLRFRWRGVDYEFVCLPFGLSSAPRVFTKVMKPVIAALRSRGIRLVIYLDDILFLNQSRDGLESDIQAAVALLQSVGFLINWEKSFITPVQSIVFLGLIIDSLSMSFALPEGKLDKTRTLCQRALAAGRVRLRDLASIMGMFSWSIPAIPFAQAHYRRVQRSLISSLRSNGSNFGGHVTLSPTARQDLTWWVDNIASVNGRTFASSEPDLVIFSDASLMGWGASCGSVTARGPWTSMDCARHINELELLAALFALQSFTSSSSQISVCLRLDNKTAVSYINRGGGTRSFSMTQISREIVDWCEGRSISVQAVYLPGYLNDIADRESRTLPDSSDWMLHSSSFSFVCSQWKCSVDLFASAWNHQLPVFYAWNPQPGAAGTDAFSVNWMGLDAYLFPPFGLIPRCLSKVRREGATVTLLSPYWPSSPWFPLLLKLASDIAIILPPRHDQLISARGEPHPMCDSIILVAWRLCGVNSVSEGFRRKWLTFSSTGPVGPHALLTSPPGLVGTVGAIGGISIPCRLP